MRIGALIGILVIISAAVVQLVRPVHVTLQQAVPAEYQVPGSTPSFQWPTTGQAVVAVSGVGEIGHYGPETPVPIASVTKIMTALLILEKHPLSAGEEGPVLTVTDADVNVYKQDDATGQSVMQVSAGEKLTERQCLQALLLPSANNIATMLANWAAGSESNFVAQMNAKAKQLGMTHTTYTDASGYKPSTVSTAVDQVKVAEQAMKIQTFREIVRMPQVTLPLAGTVFNVDYALGKSGIVGIKTGSTDQAGGCFVFAAEKPLGNQTATVIGAVLGQTGDAQHGGSALMAALGESETLAQQAQEAVTAVPVVNTTNRDGIINAPWTQQVDAMTDKSVSFIGWPGMKVHYSLEPASLGKQVEANSTVGTLTVSAGEETSKVPLHAAGAVTSPSYLWRLTHLAR